MKLCQVGDYEVQSCDMCWYYDDRTEPGAKRCGWVFCNVMTSKSEAWIKYIEDPESIPDWCLLEDYEKNYVNIKKKLLVQVIESCCNCAFHKEIKTLGEYTEEREQYYTVYICQKNYCKQVPTAGIPSWCPLEDAEE